jgi:hypothetical protein
MKAAEPEVAAYSQAFVDEAPFGGVGGTTETPAASPVLTLVPPPGPPPTASAPAATAARPAFQNSQDQKAPARAAQGSTIESIKEGLERRSRMFLVIALEGARKAVVEGDELYVEFAPEAKHLRDNLAKPESVKLLREVARDVTGRELGVRIVVKERDASGTQDEPPSKEEEARLEKQRLRQIAEQDPLVQQALRTFRAEIVDVRRIEEQ